MDDKSVLPVKDRTAEGSASQAGAAIDHIKLCVCVCVRVCKTRTKSQRVYVLCIGELG